VQSDLVALRNRTSAQGKVAQAINPSDLPALLAERNRPPKPLRLPQMLRASAGTTALADLLDRHNPTNYVEKFYLDLQLLDCDRLFLWVLSAV
jgi:hypothetical protein